MRASRIIRSPGTCWIAAATVAAIAGGLLTLACERRDAARDFAAANVPGEVPGAAGATSDYMKTQLADLERNAAAAQSEAKQEIEQARAKAQELPEETREQLDAAINRTETARDAVSDRLDALKDASEAGWDTTRQRVSDALQELAEARSEIAMALRGESTAG